ncbi:MAG: ABC transporter ATP-binding protein [Thermoplasmata archaeon]|nr:ABC transporter ATP-binding protein [Thermoplasmata archaeon]
MTMHLLEVKDLRIYFKVREGWVEAVDGVSFFVDEGETLGIVGESGCGKTTTAYAITQLLPKNAYVKGGEILFKGRDLLQYINRDGTINLFHPEIRKVRWRDISIIFQGAMDALNPVYKVGRQIEEAILAHPDALGKMAYLELSENQKHTSKAMQEAARRRVEELYDIVGIAKDRIDKYPHEYSGGMKQRALIAMALALNPPLMIADEPTTALDVITQYKILGEIKNIQKEYRMAMIMISHDISTVAEISDRMAVMYAGRLAETGNTLDLFMDPRHPYTMGLLNSIPTIKGDKETLLARLQSIPGSPPPLVNPPGGCRFHPRCPFAKSVCSRETPEATVVGPNHVVWCHKAAAESAGDEW